MKAIPFSALGPLLALCLGCGSEPQYQGKSCSYWIAQTEDRDPSFRESAAKALQAIGPAAKGAAPALMQLLDDPDADVRLAAVRALGSIGREARSAVPAVIEVLKDEDARFRVAAAEALGEMREDAKAAMPNLAALLRDPDESVRSRALIALMGMGLDAKDDLVSGLVQGLKAKQSAIRLFAVEELGRMGPDAKRAAVALGPLLGDRDPAMREAAFSALTAIGPHAKHDMVSALREGLKDAHAATRIFAAEKLAGMGLDVNNDARALSVLLRDPEDLVRSHAFMALIEMGPGAKHDTVLGLMAALKEKRSAVRVFAAERLGGMAPEAFTAIPTLVELLSDGDIGVRKAVVEALGGMGAHAKTAVPALIARLKDEDANVRVAAAEALGSIGPDAKNAVLALTEALKDNYSVRLAAQKGLAGIGPGAKSAVAALTEALRDAGEDDSVRQGAAQALAKIAPDAIPDLREQLKLDPEIRRLARQLGSGSAEVRRAAAAALERIGTNAVPAIVELLANEDWQTRWSAVQALGMMGKKAKGAVPALKRLLDDDHISVRVEAENALRRVSEEL